MIATLNPDAKVISETTLKRDLVALFKQKFEEVQIRIGKVPGKISFTFDGWTSKNVLAFVAIRAHYLNVDYVYESVLLDFSHLAESHSGLNLCNVFLDCLKRFEIPLCKVMGITMDNAFANDTFLDSMEKHGIKILTNFSKAGHHVRCLAHILNLSVQDILQALKVASMYVEADDENPEYFEEHDDEEEEENSDIGVCFTFFRLLTR